MKELLPLCAGLAAGGFLRLLVQSARLRSALAPVLCLPAGALVSFVNGELSGNLWSLFVSVDAVLVWLGAVAVLGPSLLRRRIA